MFSPEEYEYYHKNADRALSGEVVLDPPGCPVDYMFPVVYYHDGDAATFGDFTTELFSTLSEEEWFQNGTVMDLSFMEESLLRKLINLSLMARTNLNNRES